MSTTQRRAPFRRVKLTGQQKRLWEDTLAALSWIAPGFIHLIYTLLNNSGDDDVALFTDDPAMAEFTAATDGWQLIFNPTRFFKYHLLERVFIVLHEVMHEALNHVRAGYAFMLAGKISVGSKTLPYNHFFANVMQDLIINAILVAAKLGRYNKDWLHNTTIATENDNWLDVYFRMYEDRKKIMVQMGGTLNGGSPMQFDQHLDPFQSTGTDPHEAPPRNEAEWQIAINQAMEIQRAQSKLPDALKHFFDTLLNPRVEWTDHVRGLITRIMGSGAYNWQRLDRRLLARSIGAPSISGHGAGLIIVGGDTSMSVFHDKRLVHRWVGEIAGMIEDVQPEEVHVVWCDTQVRRVDICTDVQDVKRMVYDGIPGGGGTAFKPVFKYIEDNDLHPDVLIYLTDGDGSYPSHEPDYEVIWGDISGQKEKYPFGTVVRVPIDD